MKSINQIGAEPSSQYEKKYYSASAAELRSLLLLNKIFLQRNNLWSDGGLILLVTGGDSR